MTLSDFAALPDILKLTDKRSYLEINKALAKPSSPSETSQATNAALLISGDLSCWNVLLPGDANTKYDCFSELDNTVFFCRVRTPKPVKMVSNSDFFWTISEYPPSRGKIIPLKSLKVIWSKFAKIMFMMFMYDPWHSLTMAPQIHLESTSDSWIPDWSACMDASLAPSHPVVKVLRLTVD